MPARLSRSLTNGTCSSRYVHRVTLKDSSAHPAIGTATQPPDRCLTTHGATLGGQSVDALTRGRERHWASTFRVLFWPTMKKLGRHARWETFFAPAPQNFFFSAAGRERKGPKRGTPPSLGHYEDLDRFRLECRCHSVATSGGHSGHSAAFSPDHDDPVTKRECRELTWP